MVAQVFGVKKVNPVLRPEFTLYINGTRRHSYQSTLTDLVFVC
jgi:hypothetical protein